MIAADQFFMSTDREEILKEDMVAIGTSLAKYRAERWLKEDDMTALKQHFVDLLDQVYDLSVAIVSETSDSAQAQAQFNSLFKTI